MNRDCQPPTPGAAVCMMAKKCVKETAALFKVHQHTHTHPTFFFSFSRSQKMPFSPLSLILAFNYSALFLSRPSSLFRHMRMEVGVNRRCIMWPYDEPEIQGITTFAEGFVFKTTGLISVALREVISTSCCHLHPPSPASRG